MKNWPINLKRNRNSFYALALLGVVLLASPYALGKTVVRIHSLAGNAFAINGTRTWSLAKGESLEDFVEIMTEEGGQIILSDFHGNSYQLTGSGHIKIINKVMELKRGYLWVKNNGKEDSFQVHTANSVIQGPEAEAIISFDHVSGKTQVLTTQGKVSLHHILRPNLKEVISAGNFSFIEDDFEDGRPRVPTPVGHSTFQNVMSLFGGSDHFRTVSSGEREKGELKGLSSREIASIPVIRGGGGRTETPPLPGKVIFLRKGIVSHGQQQNQHHQNKVVDIEKHLQEDLMNIQHSRPGRRLHPSSASKAPLEASSVKIKILGRDQKERSPASLLPATSPVSPASLKVKEAPRGGMRENRISTEQNLEQKEFEKSLQKEKFSQKRHPDEVNQLIRDLESFSQDFEEHY